MEEMMDQVETANRGADAPLFIMPRTWGYQDCPQKARAWQAQWLERYAPRWLRERASGGWVERDERPATLLTEIEQQVAAESERQWGWVKVCAASGAPPERLPRGGELIYGPRGAHVEGRQGAA
jgi:hypothetical protein